MKTAQPQVNQTMWSRSSNVVQYTYHSPELASIHPCLASDIPLPKHMSELIAREESQHEPISLDGTDSNVATPTVDYIAIYRTAHSSITVSIWVNWRDSNNMVVHSENYFVNDWDFHEAHVGHMKKI